MTNKLPVVGNRYRATDSNKLITNKDYILTCDEILSTTVILNKEKNGSYISWPINGFFEDFEELPETKLPVVGKRYRRIGGGYDIVVGEVEQHLVYFRMADENNKESFSCPLEFFWGDFEELSEDEAETKPETQNHISELSPEVKEAMEELDRELDHWMPTEDKEEYQLTSKAEKLLNALDEQFNVMELHNIKAQAEKVDKQFMSKEEDKIDTRQERVDSIKVNETNESVDVKEEEVKEKESIWKPVNELPTNNAHCLVKCNDANKNHVFSAVFLAKEQAKGNKGFVDLAAQHLGGMNYSKEYITLTEFINDYEKLKERVKKLEEK